MSSWCSFHFRICLNKSPLQSFCYEILKGIRSISGAEVPVYAWQSASATAVLYLFGPEYLGGNGDLAEKISKITAEDPTVRDQEIEAVRCFLHFISRTNVSHCSWVRFTAGSIRTLFSSQDFLRCMTMSMSRRRFVLIFDTLIVLFSC